MQVPILAGVYTDNGPDLRVALPVNFVAVPAESGVSGGYLRPADGIATTVANSPGPARGGINWLGICYSVCGSKLVSIAADTTIVELGDVGDDQLPVTMVYGPKSTTYPVGLLAIASAGSSNLAVQEYS